jgi:hypothetical protein
MKRFTIILIVAVVGLVSWAQPVKAAKPLTPQEEEELARNRALAQEAVSFQSAAAENARNPGSPVGPPQRVTICFRGRTISVPAPAVAAYLKRGAKRGPCHHHGGKGDDKGDDKRDDKGDGKDDGKGRR